MSGMDYQAYPILYVDDEVTNLQGMRYLLDDRFTLLTTSDPGEALKILSDEHIAVLLTDQRMPVMTGTELCAAKRTHGSALGDLERLAGLSRRLRDGSTIKSALAARCDVVRAVDAMVRILRSEIERDGTLEVQVRGTPAVRMEASALGTVIMQLLINAAQARGDRPRERHRICVSVEASEDEAVISVSDNGVGIPAEVRDRLFDPRFSTKPDNEGLGLAIVRDIVGSAKGTVEVFSEVGIGTTLTVRLPVVRS